MPDFTTSLPQRFDFKEAKKNVILLTSMVFFLIYFIQNLFVNFFFPEVHSSYHYSLESWVEAYVFVFISAVVFLMFLYWGLEGKDPNISLLSAFNKHDKTVRLSVVIFVFFVFFLWSYTMLQLKVGMTIYSDFEPLPYRLVGLLFYGRLFIQPLILGYIASTYSHSRHKALFLCLLLLLAAWVALTSGSRFSAIMFSLPLMCLFHGKKKYIFLFIAIIGGILIASASRVFYLPFQISEEYIQIFSNEYSKSHLTENFGSLPIIYIFMRMMGINEVLLTLNYGTIASSNIDSVLSLISYFFRFFSYERSVSIKNIYGLSNNTFGGLGLDFFSNYWFYFGGNVLTYVVGLSLIAWLFGKSYKLFAIALFRYGLSENAIIIYILLFLIIFDGRAFMLVYLFPLSWVLSTQKMNIYLNAIQRFFTQYRAI